MANLFTELILVPLNGFLGNVQAVLPGLLIALVLIIVGYFISSLIGWIVKKFLYRINLDKRLRGMDLHDSIGDISIAKLTGIILKWYVFIIFLNQAIVFVSLGRISAFLNVIVAWLPQLILSITIIILGLILIDFIVHKILELHNRYIKLMANIIKIILIIVVVFTAIEQLGVKTDLAQNIFLMIVASVLVTFSLAFGIGLGLSLKDELKPWIRGYSKKKKRR